MHTRCFAESKHAKNGTIETAHIVGHLSRDKEGRWVLVDCNGDVIPFGKILDEYEGHLISINMNNLDYDYQAFGTTITRTVYHDAP